MFSPGKYGIMIRLRLKFIGLTAVIMYDIFFEKEGEIYYNRGVKSQRDL